MLDVESHPGGAASFYLTIFFIGVKMVGRVICDNIIMNSRYEEICDSGWIDNYTGASDTDLEAAAF